MKNHSTNRCSWANTAPIYIDYHDTEWGVPVFDEQKLFESLILDGMQAGLSWITILKRRENYRQSFDNFDPLKIIKYNQRKIDYLLNDTGIIRNKLKIQSVITNAQAYLETKEEWGNFSDYIWHFVDGKPIKNKWKRLDQIPPSSSISDAMSKDLKKRGFKFVGATICYAFMQAKGLVNDHLTTCFRHNEVG